MPTEDGHNRRSIRLRDFDYAAPGAYFVTICASERGCIFGGVVGGQVHPTLEGQVVQDVWTAIPNHFPVVTLDDSVIMPDHLHGILVIADRGDGTRCEWEGAGVVPGENVGARHAVPEMRHGATRESDDDIGEGHAATAKPGDDIGARHAVPLRTVERFGHPVASSVPTIVRSFKAATTKRINEMRGTPGAPVWQRNYYEHVVRDEADLDRIRKYIADNLAREIEDSDKPWRE